MMPVNIRRFKFSDWNFCLAYSHNPPIKIGAGQIQLKIENGWNVELQTPSLVVLEKGGNRNLYEKL